MCRGGQERHAVCVHDGRQVGEARTELQAVRLQFGQPAAGWCRGLQPLLEVPCLPQSLHYGASYVRRVKRKASISSLRVATWIFPGVRSSWHSTPSFVRIMCLTPKAYTTTVIVSKRISMSQCAHGWHVAVACLLVVGACCSCAYARPVRVAAGASSHGFHAWFCQPRKRGSKTYPGLRVASDAIRIERAVLNRSTRTVKRSSAAHWVGGSWVFFCRLRGCGTVACGVPQRQRPWQP